MFGSNYPGQIYPGQNYPEYGGVQAEILVLSGGAVAGGEMEMAGYSISRGGYQEMPLIFTVRKKKKAKPIRATFPFSGGSVCGGEMPMSTGAVMRTESATMISGLLVMKAGAVMEAGADIRFAGDIEMKAFRDHTIDEIVAMLMAEDEEEELYV